MSVFAKLSLVVGVLLSQAINAHTQQHRINSWRMIELSFEKIAVDRCSILRTVANIGSAIHDLVR
jgi:hypothetical protein